MGREADAREAWSAITRLFIGRENQGRFPLLAEEFGVTVRLLHAVLDLPPGEGLPMRQLAQQWYCDASNVTAIVDSLEDRGLAHREPSPVDRRVKLVSLTDAGVTLRNALVDRLLTPPSGIMGLSADELRTLRQILAKAVEGYEPLG